MNNQDTAATSKSVLEVIVVNPELASVRVFSSPVGMWTTQAQPVPNLSQSVPAAVAPGLGRSRPGPWSARNIEVPPLVDDTWLPQTICLLDHLSPERKASRR